jgi:hypothetical protein
MDYSIEVQYLLTVSFLPDMDTEELRTVEKNVVINRAFAKLQEKQTVSSKTDVLSMNSTNVKIHVAQKYVVRRKGKWSNFNGKLKMEN